MEQAYYDGNPNNKLNFSEEVGGVQTATRQLDGFYTQKETYIANVIYAASEDPIPGVTGKMLADKVRTTTGQEVEYMADQPTILDHLEHEAQSGDLIMTIGAGDIYKLGEHLVQALERRN